MSRGGRHGEVSFSSKLQKADHWRGEGLDGEGNPRRRSLDFWAKLAKAFELGDLGVDTVRATRYDLQGGSREHLRVIWDALGVYADGYSSFDVNTVLFESSLATMHLAWNSEELKEKLWIDFEITLDRAPKRWPEALKQELQYEDSDSDSESEDFIELELD